jgi:hypothetical protein
MTPLLLAVPVVPVLPVSAYGGALLSNIFGVLVNVLPYAGAVAALVIGVHMLRRWLGHRDALWVASLNRREGETHGENVRRQHAEIQRRRYKRAVGDSESQSRLRANERYANARRHR